MEMALVGNLRAAGLGAFRWRTPRVPFPPEFGDEIWDLYRQGVLHADTPLSGRFTQASGLVNVGAVRDVIDDARAEESARRLCMGPG